MIISRTPYRISFFGGGTDYPAWYLQHGGAVLSTTVDKYCYVMCRHLPPFFEHRLAVRYSQIEVRKSVSEIQHPTVRETLRYLNITRGVEINHAGDLPARSGMGSSSSFTVGLLHALHGLEGRMQTKRQLAREAQHIEQHLIRETVGSQDQVAAAYGGFNVINFARDGSFHVRPVTILAKRKSELSDNLMLFYTGLARTASEVAASYVEQIDERAKQLQRMQQLVSAGIDMITSSTDLSQFGELLHEAWLTKRTLSHKVTNDHLDEVYDAARSAGAIGGKIAGAGGGGFMLLFVPPARQAAVRRRLSKLIHVPFEFDDSGSQIIFSDSERDYASEEALRDKSETELAFGVAAEPGDIDSWTALL